MRRGLMVLAIPVVMACGQGAVVPEAGAVAAEGIELERVAPPAAIPGEFPGRVEGKLVPARQQFDVMSSSAAEENPLCAAPVSDCVDLHRMVEYYESGRPASEAPALCREQADNTALVIPRSGSYVLNLDWYNSAGNMTLAMLRPAQRFLGRWHGQASGEVIPLGWMEEGEHLVLGNVTFWHSQAFGPIDSGDATSYDIRATGTGFEVFMDEGIHFDCCFNDAHFFIDRVEEACDPEPGCTRMESDCAAVEDLVAGYLARAPGEEQSGVRCEELPVADTLTVAVAGDYVLDLDWYHSAAQMSLFMFQPVAAVLATWHGYVENHVLSLGWLEAGEQLVLGNMALWHEQVFGPFDSGDPSFFDITPLEGGGWEIYMDEGVEYDCCHNDAHYFVYPVASSCEPASPEPPEGGLTL